MSCIVGVINLDGAPVDRQLLGDMTGAMETRAPDGSSIWCSGHVGFGHAVLRVSDEAEDRWQPLTLDNEVWITADARIDGRDELIRRLRAAGYDGLQAVPDAELILHAYNLLGETFLQNIIGDFAFALWDSRTTTLICARDHFGVRPFFYVKTDHIFLFASDIAALLRHPAVSTQLDDEFVGDFLLFGNPQNSEQSIYRDIRRLPAASYIRTKRDEFYLRRYWTLPRDQEIRFRRQSDYIDRFQELLVLAVTDRLSTNRTAFELSGGMDSTTIASLATTSAHSVTAYTVTAHDLLPADREGYYAGMVASYLDIPVSFYAVEDYPLFDRFDSPQLHTSEPCASPDLAMHHDKINEITKNGARVLLSGQGGDALCATSNAYFMQLLRSGRIVRFLAEIYRHVRRTGSLAGMGLRSALLGSTGKPPWRPDFPEWLDQEFVKRTDLDERWHAGWETMHRAVGTYDQLLGPWVSSLFETYEALRMPLVMRHPFFDLRLAVFCLNLPDYIKNDKLVMREATRGKLPEPVRTRPKTPLPGDRFREKFTRSQIKVPVESRLSRVGNRYIDTARYGLAFKRYLDGEGMESTWSSYYMVSPIALNIWLTQPSKDL